MPVTKAGIYAAAAVAWLAAAAVPADEEPACPPDTLPYPAIDPKYTGTPLRDLPIELEADQAESLKDGPVWLKGNAVITQGRPLIWADEIRYDEKTDVAEAKGQVRLRTRRGDEVRTSFLRYRIETGIGTSEAARYKLVDPEREVADGRIAVSGRGRAQRIHFEGHGLMRLERARYTSCVQGQDDVMIYGREIKLDQTTGVGFGKNVTLKFKNVPIFYLPVMSFPISDERKTGFLTPRFGGEGASGYVLSVPYYWNIAPNMDATFTPKYMENRGLQLEGEFRYLQHDFEGTIHGIFLPNDRLFEDEDDDRGVFRYTHGHRFGERWSGAINYQWVSDPRYFDDFSNELGISSQTHLQEEISLDYNGPLWSVSSNLEWYQTIDENIPEPQRPHKKLPRVSFSTHLPPGLGGLNYGLEGSLTNFDHDFQVSGLRLVLAPYVSWPLNRPYGFLTPKLKLQHTSYDIRDASATPSLTVPILSVDAGLFFERDLRWAGRKMVQTLEPRLFYVFAPERDQAGLPNFDTGRVALDNFNNSFRDTRFEGFDRVGDDNRLTVALTTRLFDWEDGAEWGRASIGQIFYFDDREVTLSGRPETERRSDIIGEIDVRLTEAWNVKAFGQWDIDIDKFRETRVDVGFRPEDGKWVTAAYLFTRDAKEQASVHVGWPLARRWSFEASYLYSLLDRQLLETFAVLTYDACCWALHLRAQRRVDTEEEFRNSLVVALELPGLTTIRKGF